jgi:hypothetical protein
VEIIGGIRELVDQALDWLLDRAVSMGRNILSSLRGENGEETRTDSENSEALGLARQRVTERTQRPFATREELENTVQQIEGELIPRGLNSLTISQQGDGNQYNIIAREDVGDAQVGASSNEAEISAAVSTARTNHSLAVTRYQSLATSGLPRKTVACSSGRYFVSGWSSDESRLATTTRLFEQGKEREQHMSVIEQIEAEERRQLTGQRIVIEGLEYDPRRAGFFDQGSPGQYASSHAEKQAHMMNPGEPIGVSRAMCGDCINYFKSSARASGTFIVVADPNVIRVFKAEGGEPEIR